MWLMTKHGFYSIVCAHDEMGAPHKKLMMIRARKKEHLERLKERFGLPGGVVENTGTDYSYRIIIERAVVVPLVARLMDEVDYSNFKNAAADAANDDRYDMFLHSVWASGLNMARPTLPDALDGLCGVPTGLDAERHFRDQPSYNHRFYFEGPGSKKLMKAKQKKKARK